MTLPEVKQVHFIGIGGYGMSALAQVLLQMGYQVTGSDINDSALVRQLAARGAEIKLFHHPDHIGSSELVIHSTAIPRTTASCRRPAGGASLSGTAPSCWLP